MNIINTLIGSVYAAPTPTITIGTIRGVGPFGFEDETVSDLTTKSQFGSIISTIVTTLTVIGGLAFAIFFTLGGLKWLTAGGDKAKVQEAQNQMTQGVIGLVVLVAGLFVIGLIGNILGIDILNPFKTLFGTI